MSFNFIDKRRPYLNDYFFLFIEIFLRKKTPLFSIYQNIFSLPTVLDRETTLVDPLTITSVELLLTRSLPGVHCWSCYTSFELVIDACHSSSISLDLPLRPLVNSCGTARKPSWFRVFVSVPTQARLN